MDPRVTRKERTNRVEMRFAPSYGWGATARMS